MEVNITINRMVQDYDVLLILGPVFPHEVVGFSGGNKYLFPGIAGQEIIDFFHWLGAVITNPVIIGNKWTPVRKVVDRAATLLKAERRAMCMVVKGTRPGGPLRRHVGIRLVGRRRSLTGPDSHRIP
jgi:lactate racemase